MYTSVLLVALAGFVPSLTSREPVWWEDYSQACRQCQKIDKPMAVFVGSGSGGWNQLSRGGRLSDDTNELLAKSFVCVYVNAKSGHGQELATALEMPNHLGIVITDSTGRLQAFRHEGDLSSADLARYLQRYSDPQRLVVSTESVQRGEAPVRAYRSEKPIYGGPPPRSSFSIGRSC
jgi:hypothetical protein